jgi:hypothetical protein
MTHGRALPLIVEDFNLEDITTDGFDPVTTLHDADNVSPAEMTEERAIAKYEKKGFMVRPNADGALYVVTHRQYIEACKTNKQTLATRVAILATLEPKKWNGVANSWCECPVIKVFGGSGDRTGHYASIATEIIVGIIL